MQHNYDGNATPNSHVYQAYYSPSTSHNGSPVSSHRRRHTPTPSFMNYQNGAAAKALTQSTPTTPVEPAPQITAKSRPPRTLLLAFSGTPPTITVRNVERLLRSQSITSIAVLANTAEEQSTKDLKMQLYSLVGQLQQEIGVHVYLREQWSETECESAVHHMGHISTVLCSYSFDRDQDSTDILAVSEQKISETWRNTFGFLHAIAKACFPNLLPIEADEKTMFATTGTSKPDSAAAKVSQAACESLLAQLSSQYAAQGVSVGQIEKLLPPERKPVFPKKENGIPKLEIPARPQDVGTGENEGGESPTRLYEMWALHEQLDTV